RPLYGATQRLVPLDAMSRPAGQKPEALVQSVANLRGAERTHSCGSQLDREWNAVESTADLAHHGIVCAEREIGRHGARSCDEQPRRGWRDAFTSERRHGPDLFALDRQGGIARTSGLVDVT